MVQHASLILVPRVPYQDLRRIAVAVSGTSVHVYDRHLNVRPLPAQLLRFAKAWLEWHVRTQSPARRWLRRVLHPRDALVPIYAQLAYAAGRLRRTAKRDGALPAQVQLPSGISVIIPSRDGLDLLRECLPALLAQEPSQVIVVDNGSRDQTTAWLAQTYPFIEAIAMAEPLSFARAINLGLQSVRFSHVLLLNNDMVVASGFLRHLERPFQGQPDLFASTAEILFPAGVRRQETGKAVFRETQARHDFPVHCELPLAGEDGTWVLYGSGGCSLFSTVKFRALGCMNEALRPAYVEDLDLGFRAWQQEWPTVLCSRAQVEHRHRSTTSRYWTEQQLSDMVQLNYLRFLISAIASPVLFQRLWSQAIRRLHLSGARNVLRSAVSLPFVATSARTTASEERILALTNGDVALFPGRQRSGKPVVVIASAYLPYPLSHGGAVRIFNLLSQAVLEFDVVLVSFTEHWVPPAPELLALAAEVVLVRRAGTHYRSSSTLPDTVEEFASLTFASALRQTVAKWQAAIVQLEWTQMAQYARDCAPAKTVLVEHDITFDLYQQMMREQPGDATLALQFARWQSFEKDAWTHVDRIVTMSAKDRSTVGRAGALTIPNGVDLERFTPFAGAVDEDNTLLFIGSFAHHPNRSAVEWFLEHVWPLLEEVSPTLHIIAGNNAERWPLAVDMPRVHIEGFVPDVRPAYRQASVVIAPLIASAGTNIKILEAMAMGKAIVSTPAGINGLDVNGVLLAGTAQEFANRILLLLKDADLRRSLGQQARQCVEQFYSWRNIARTQTKMYRQLMGEPDRETES